MKMKAAQVVCECLLEQGVDTVFGYPGGTILNIYDALYGYEGKIHHILTAHEQGASHAADGYARSTGKVGVCFATSGPGATNLTTGIATAYYDSSPVVFLTVNVPEPLIGKDTFQEVDITGITMPITKANFLVRDANTLADTLRTAFAIARSGRPGPVLIDILKNVTAEEIDYEFLPLSEHANHGRLKEILDIASHDLKSREREPDQGDVDTLLEMIEQAKKPVVLCGGGVIRSDGAVPEFRKFFETLNAPVISTMMGGGACPGNHPLFAGMVGMHGTHAANIAVSRCDLLIAVGCRFSDRVALSPKHFAANAKIVHIDIDRAEIDKNIITDHHIIGDSRRVLEMLNAKLQPHDYPEWKEYVFSNKEVELKPVPGKLLPSEVLDSISKLTNGDAIIATDVGQHQMWVAQYFHFNRPGQLITSGGFGTMGFGLGAAMGAKLGNPDKVVVHATGDGSFRMNCNELATVQHYGLPIITVLFNNQTLGMVRQWQTLMYDHRYSQTTLDRGPDFVKLAEAYGLNGCHVSNIEDFEAAFQAALASDKATVIDCAIDTDEMVHPMVPGGKPNTDFLLD